MSKGFEPLGLDHVVLRVRDQAVSERFYVDVLGCTVDHVNTQISLVQLRFGDALIDLLPADGPPPSEGRAPLVREFSHPRSNGAVTSDAEGRFALTALVPGTYGLSVSRPTVTAVPGALAGVTDAEARTGERVTLVATGLGLIASAAEAQLDQILKGLGGGGAGAGLSDAKIGAGLKEALQVATEKTVSLTGKTDGYSNPQIYAGERIRAVLAALQAQRTAARH